MLKLAHGDIHLWLAFPNAIQDPDLLDSYKQILTKEERDQQQRFHFPEDRHRYLVTRVLVRTVLSRYSMTPPESWCFTKNAYGRPEIISESVYEKSLSFNISHTKDLILCGISQHQTLGVDTENTHCRQAPVEVGNYFSRQELSALSNLPKQLQHERFFHYWTLKEAYIKARGMGLSLPLDQFSFNFPDHQQVQVEFDSRMNDSAKHWSFWLLKLSKSHLGAVCAQRLPGVAQELIVKRTIPLESETSFSCLILKQS